MAGDETIMLESAFLMIYDPSGQVMGTAAHMRAMVEALDKIGAALIRGYAARSGKAEDELAKLMAAETGLDASEAIDMGLADTLAAPVQMAARFDVSGFRNPPAVIIAAVKAAAKPEAENPRGTADPASEQAPEPAAAPDPAAIRNGTMSYAKAGVDLCRLAGQPQMAAGFHEAETSLEDVRKALVDARAAADPNISATHSQPGPAPPAKPWRDVITRTFKLKG